jgi:hypothetical protein
VPDTTDSHALPFPARLIKKVEFGLTSRYHRPKFSPIYSFSLVRQKYNSKTTLTFPNGDYSEFLIGDRQIEISKAGYF